MSIDRGRPSWSGMSGEGMAERESFYFGHSAPSEKGSALGATPGTGERDVVAVP